MHLRRGGSRNFQRGRVGGWASTLQWQNQWCMFPKVLSREFAFTSAIISPSFQIVFCSASPQWT